MPCVKLTLTNRTIFFLLSQEKAFRTCSFTSTPSKSLSGLLTGSVIGLFIFVEPVTQTKILHGDPAVVTHCLAEELTEKWQPWEACVCIHIQRVCALDGRRRRVREQALVKVCSTACVDLMRMNVCPCSSADLLKSASVSVLSTYLLCAHNDSRPNWLSQRRWDDSLCGTM